MEVTFKRLPISVAVKELLMPPPVPISRDRVIKVADSLPCAPRVLMELQELLVDTNADIEAVTMLLRRDGSLTARIIRIANGIVYGRGDPVGSLEDALARVGFREVYRLTSTASMLQLAEVPLRFYPMTPKALRENSLLCGLLMEEMAGDAALDARTAYTAGLLRAVGRIVLDVTAQRDLRFLRPKPIGEEGLIPWELEMFGLTSGDAATSVLKTWRFQADVWVAIRDQFLHNLSMEALPMAKLLHVAIGAAAQAGYPLPGGIGYIEANLANAMHDLNFSDEYVTEALNRAIIKFDRMKTILG